MSETVKGTAHIWGIQGGTITNATVQSYSVTESFNNTAETMDEDGNRIEVRGDDLVKSGTITIKVQASYTKPSVFDNLTYDSDTFWIETIDKAESNGDFVIYTLSITNSEYITLS